MSYSQRLYLIRKFMKGEGLDGIIIMDRANTFYSSGFRGTYSLILIMHDVALFMTDSRYFEAAVRRLGSDFEVVRQKNDGKCQLKCFFGVRGKLHIGFEPSIPYEKYRWLREAISPARLVDAGNLLKIMRFQKDAGELQYIKRAASITDRCFQKICKEIRPGVTERDLAVKIRRFFDDAGAESESFPAIVASGPNAALPHHQSSKRKFKQGDCILIDMGCRVGGYCSDMTRTVFLGEIKTREKEIYKIVFDAQQRGLQAVKPGIPARHVDYIVRQFILESGYGDFFGHNTGHGVGIEVHEPPVVGSRSEDLIEEGMVLTIEPGIYIPGRFGVRIEDLALVTKEGASILSKTSKKLKIIS
jgi:Xaa-Pro aminopeptidase